MSENKDLIYLLDSLTNEINNLRTYLLHSRVDIMAGEVDSGACSAPTDRTEVGPHRVQGRPNHYNKFLNKPVPKAEQSTEVVRCYMRGDRLTHPSLTMTREQADKGGYTIAGPAHGYVDQAAERDRFIAQASEKLAAGALDAFIERNDPKRGRGAL